MKGMDAAEIMESKEPQVIEAVDLFIAGGGIGQFETNEELQRHLRRGLLRTGILMTVHTFLNRFRSPQKLKLLPP
jgi:hypothetical protein